MRYRSEYYSEGHCVSVGWVGCYSMVSDLFCKDERTIVVLVALMGPTHGSRRRLVTLNSSLLWVAVSGFKGTKRVLRTTLSHATAGATPTPSHLTRP